MVSLACKEFVLFSGATLADHFIIKTEYLVPRYESIIVNIAHWGCDSLLHASSENMDLASKNVDIELVMLNLLWQVMTYFLLKDIIYACFSILNYNN